jgi:branched-chain amino acid transport system ATP-binding protein
MAVGRAAGVRLRRATAVLAFADRTAELTARFALRSDSRSKSVDDVRFANGPQTFRSSASSDARPQPCPQPCSSIVGVPLFEYPSLGQRTVWQRQFHRFLWEGARVWNPSMNSVLLSAKNLSVRFGGVLAVNNVSFDVKQGEVFTLIGPNGAGKTTVFNLISRIYTPTTGEIEYLGKKLTDQPPHKIASLGIARTFQNIELFEHATVLNNLLIGRHTHHTSRLWSELLFTGKTRQAEIDARRKVEEVIEFLDLQHHRDSLVAGLPYGVRKVVELARALCTEPKLLLLDEPSSGLNVEETDDMAFWIQDIKHELGITVLMVEHDMTLVSKVSDRVLAMNQGEVLAMGTPREVQMDPGVIEAYLGSIDDVSSLRRAA